MNKEIVIVMGFPASGKSTAVESFVGQGYSRVNRDTLGGTIEAMASRAEMILVRDNKSVVLDNLYPTVKSRATLIELSKRHKIPIRCYMMETGLEDAQLNACIRMIRKTGLLLTESHQYKCRNDPNTFPVVVIYKYRKEYEKPTLAEGFSQVVSVPFVRTWPKDYVNKAIILDYDGTLRLCKDGAKFPTKPEQIKILPRRTEVLKAWKAKGYELVGVSNQSGVAKGDLTIGEARACFDATNKMLGLNIAYSFCPHKVPPITCYCRKPNPGLGAWAIETHKLNPSECIMVGDMGSDKTFAARCGFQYQDATEFFK